MVLAHEHVLGCQRCNSPLFVTRRDESDPHSTARTRLVLIYEQPVAGLLGAKSVTPSFLHTMREDRAGVQRRLAPLTTSLHVLHMDGFDKPETRRDFAEHCGLDREMLEGHFVTIGRLAGAEVGACWCECHSGREHVQSIGKACIEDDYMPMMPSPLVVDASWEGVRTVLGCQEAPDETKPRKRKRWSSADARRWPLLSRPYLGEWKGELDMKK